MAYIIGNRNQKILMGYPLDSGSANMAAIL